MLDIQNEMRKIFEEDVKARYPFISHFTWDEDEEDGDSVHICWFKFPYISLESMSPYFHFKNHTFEKYISAGHRTIVEDDLLKYGISYMQYGMWGYNDETFFELVKEINKPKY